jgi:hypothetical protein
MSDTTGRTGVALPSRVRVGDRPKAATINSLIDALGDRRVTLGNMPFRQSGVATAIDQFSVRRVGDTHVKIYGGVWQRIRMTRYGSSPPYEFHPKTVVATLGTPFEWEDEEEITETVEVWLKLDWSITHGTLTAEYLTAAPDMDEEGVYWVKIADVAVAGGVIVDVRQIHTGAIVTTDYGNPRLCQEDEEEE